MHKFLLFAAVIGVSVFASPQAAPSATTRVNPRACARISSSGATTFSASFAYECLRSVPNRIQPAQQLIQSLKAFVEWQSTLAWLKNPPKSYGFPAVDIQGSLDKILETAKQGGYESEYDFQVAIVQTISVAHDGHFFYMPDVFKAFTFENRLAQDIVSVSIDGVSLPKLYRFSALRLGSAVPIAQINGQNAASFIVDLGSRFGNFQDSDAQWNSQFPTYANPTAKSPWGTSQIYLGPRLTLTYENGKSEFGDTVAILNQGAVFSGITTGDDYYNRFCTPKPPSRSPNQAAVTPSKSKRSASPRALPPSINSTLIAQTPENTMTGFFLGGVGVEDVAVLAITAFEEEDNNYLTSFQNAVQDFLAQCRSTKKQRLVIDLTSNGGGLIAAGFALFAQLFPGVDKFTANNMRLADSLVDISQIFSSLSPQDKKDASQAFGAFFNNISPTGVAEPQGDKFKTVEDIMSPVTLQNDRFTEYIGEPYSVLAESGNGNAGQATFPPSPFKPENIVLLTDGACSSTCTTFSYLMLFQERVKTVSVGGRPQNTQMQSLGGVEGGQSLGMSDIAQAAFVALSLAGGQSQGQPQKSDLSVLAEAYAVRRAADPNSPGGVNFKNNFAPSDSKTPLQFLYEPANCRFFYTPDMISNPEPVWEYAVAASWTDPGKYCVRGSRVAVDGPRPLDPAFAKDGATTTTTTGGSGGGGGGGGVADGTRGTDGAKGGDENAAEEALGRGSIRTMSLLVVVSVLMLCL
ncbi:hypothetical protein F4814DRAFT_456784 [Daldinia grandis]|nr:hypothetical protein F4814DRAFT_456784 [Daldinia grandis]